MNELIEAGDPRTKVVGKRRMPPAGSACIAAGSLLNRAALSIRQRPFRVKRGVYRFSTQAAADEWTMNLLIR